MSDSQMIFDRTLRGLWIAIKWITWLLVFTPMFVVTYGTMLWLLDERAIKSYEAFQIIFCVIPVVTYLLLYLVKGMMIGLKERGNRLWMIIFILLTALVSIPSGWAVLALAGEIKEIENPDHYVVWIVAIFFGYYVFLRYRLLDDVAPYLVAPFYRLGRFISKSNINTGE